MKLITIALVWVALCSVGLAGAAHAAEPAERHEPTKGASPMNDPKPAATKDATFGGGCFWCTEAVFQQIDGVSKVESGYSGGKVPDPTYEAVCTGTTGHAECIQITYDPAKVPFEKLLEVFFKTHNPTTLNYQGNDHGTQYRSAVFYHDEEQRLIAEKVKAALDASGAFPEKIVTEITPFKTFYKAEDYHQNYFVRNPRQGYCFAIIGPKVEKFQKAFKDLLKKDH